MPATRKIKRISLWLGYILFLLLLAELGCRAFWTVRGLAFFTCHNRIYRIFYPEMQGVESASIDADDGSFDVLMLGASVLDPQFGNIERLLREKLAAKASRPSRVFNVSALAHTSLDSLYKYRHLSDKRFDLVLFYHGINEVRANNCPASVFKNDYSHYAWYRLLNDYEHSTTAGLVVFPYTLRFALIKFEERLGSHKYLPAHQPRTDWLEHGSNIKTKGPFRANLSGIIALARQRGDRVMPMTFSFYQTEGFVYPSNRTPIYLWGRPEAVVAGIGAHNAVVEELARKHPELLFVDQNGRIPKDRDHFTDICHLTAQGCERFVDNVLDEISPLL